MGEQTLGQMVVKLDLDSSAFGSGLAGAKKAATSAMAEMKASMKIAASTGDKIATLAEQQKGLMKEIQAQAKIMNSAQKEYSNSFDKTTGQATKSTAMYAKAYNDAVGKMAQFQSQAVKAAGQQAVLQTKTRGVTGAINTMGTKMTSAGKTLSSFGSKATWGVTVPIVAAFAAAGKQALQFQNQLNTIKNLLITSGESGASAIKAVSQMQSQSVTLSNKYGVSVTKISQGYEDLVRRGYTGAQAVASMKTELQGALASGDDFNDVVKVASETIEAFGMRSNNTATQTKNTKTAVNELAYAADATATDFADLGLGMSYVGSSAHQAGFSLSETSAAMGILSNNGLSAQKAGTGLRKVVISLTTAVGKIDSKNSVLAKLGIKKAEMVDANGNLKNMSTIMGVLAKHTQGMSKTKKATVFNSLFGTTGQQAGIILSQNASALAKLNKQVEASVGKNYVGELSQKNLASAQNQLRIFMETAKNLGMVLAEDVLPTITPLMGDAAKLADKFAHLDPSVRKATVAFIAAVAAIGPLSSGLGIVTGVLGKTSTSLVSAIANVRKWSAEVKMAKEASDISNVSLGLMQLSTSKVGTTLEAGSGKLKTFGDFMTKYGGNTTKAAAAFETYSGSAKAAGAAATEASTGAKALGGALSVGIEPGVALAGTLGALGLAAGVAAIAIGGSAIIWEKWGKKAYESDQRTQKWGSDIGSAADATATKFQGWEAKASGALDGASGSAKANATAVNQAFQGMVKSTEAAMTAHEKAVKQLVNEVGGTAGDTIAKNDASETKTKSNALAQMKQYASEVSAITAQAAKNGGHLTVTQQTTLRNLQQQMAEAEVKTLGVSKTQQKAILKVYSDSQGSLTKLAKNGQLDSVFNATNDAMLKQSKDFESKKAKIDKAYQDGTIKTKSDYNQAMSKLESDYMTKNQAQLIALAKMQNAYGKSQGLSRDKNLASTKEWLMDTMNLTSKQADAIMAAATKTVKAGKTAEVSLKGLTGYTRKAADDWNSIVLDPKTGEMKTNAQEAVNDALTHSEQWDNIELLIKEGKMSTNASEMVATGLIAQGRWNDAEWVIKHAHLNDDTKAALISAMVSAGDWNSKDWKVAKMLAKDQTNAAVISALNDMGQWQSLTPKQKQMIANARTAKDVRTALRDMGLWNTLPVEVKSMIARDMASGNASAASRALQYYYNHSPNKTTTLTTEYISVHKNYAQAVGGRVLRQATGTNNFPGGLAMVNDQKGPTFREAISDPVLGDFILNDRNVVLPLSRHAKVYRAALTKQMYPGLPQFASGLNVPASATPLQMAREVSQQSTAEQATTVMMQNDSSSTDTRLDMLISVMTKLLDKDFDVYMDKVKVGHEISHIVKQDLARDQHMTNRRKGYLT